MGGLLTQQRDDKMEMRPYFDRPQAVIQEYLVQIDEFIDFAYPNWGASNRGIWCKGEFGRGTLRADHMSILDTQGQWIVPNRLSWCLWFQDRSFNWLDRQGS